MAQEEKPNSAPGASQGAEEITWEEAFQDAAKTQGASLAQASPTAPGAEARTAPASGNQTGAIDIDFLLDVALDLTVEVGRRKMLVKEMLQLGQGSVIPLEKEVGEPMQVYVNGKLMAYGEVVVVNEKFGIRLTDIIDPKERIAQLA